MTISEFFERLGAPRRNRQWSWGAIGQDGHVYLAVWNDEFRTRNGRRFVQVTAGRNLDSTSYRERERQDHIRAIRSGAKVFCVILTAIDRRADRRRIQSFDATSLMVGGELVEDDEGRVWLEDAGRCGLPAADRRPRLVSSRSQPGERPRSAGPVERGPSEGASSRLAGQQSSSGSRPPETVPGSPRERRRARGTALQSLQGTLDAPDGVFGVRETRTDSARERHRARETALQLLYQWDVGGIGAGEMDDALELFWAVHPAPPPRRELALGLARGAVSALPDIDSLIGRHTANWRSERLAVVDRLIMRLAVYELLFEKTPPAVVINEALELAKTFSGERAVAFINGVLDAVRREVAQQGDRSALGT